MTSFLIPNYQNDAPLFVDNIKSKLTDFQINTIIEIAQANLFSSFEDFTFLEEREAKAIKVIWNNKFSNCVFSQWIGLDKLPTELKIIRPIRKYNVGASVNVQFVAMGQGNTFGSDAYENELASVSDYEWDDAHQKWKYKVVYGRDYSWVFEHNIS